MKPDWLRVSGIAVTAIGIAGVAVCLGLAGGIQQRELATLAYRGILLSVIFMACGAILVANARRRRNLDALESGAASPGQPGIREGTAEDIARPRLLGTPTQRRVERRRRSVARRRRRDRGAKT